MKLEDIQPEWLTELLRAGGSLPSGAVAAVQVNHSSRHFSTVARLQVQYTADAPSTAPTALFLKSSNRPSEGVFHAEVKPTLRDAPAIRCLGSRVEQEVTWLLFDDLSGTHLSLPEDVPPTRAIYEQMVDCLAGLHVQRWEDAQMRERFATRNGDPSYGFLFKQTLGAFGGFVDALEDRLSGERRALYERVLEVWPRMCLERIQRGHGVTMIHGDAHPWNFLLPRPGQAGRLFLADWADWRFDSGTHDLAFLVSLPCFPEQRARMEQELVRRYCQRLNEGGVRYGWEECWLDYRKSVIGNLLWPVFWWSLGSPSSIWWPNLERAVLAFQEQGCEELL
ncbi:hypothetical protein D187_009672 [Cystobacter fuscus DSM 2262]|uniref:Aminoglycoside phosphotransferase domain-containing protein n=1 Tax=Cystobacter fuscus (strain ATCC 25194 / DSM 2262 / NBRC 100088 / M29) TaxID=1242864 RepID=S9QF04_CYSF2|nr:aminoglycoside phosphotransferase family protein [Cystobacter fuscus]EPX54933.1 hypothetical protein D187_009672 [Cystobacter fuscus DSM 2262]